MRTPGEDDLTFETIALLAKDDTDEMDEVKVKQLIKIFRPDREGRLSKLEFVKSVDNVYKACLLYTSPSPRDQRGSRMPSSA